MYTCKHGCGYTNEHRGGMNIHENIHCELRPPKTQQKTKQHKTKGHVCEFRVLSSAHPLEAQAIQRGYKEICDSCQEIK